MHRPFINYAHRGASSYAPENTMQAFYLGEYLGANGIETDVQRSRDGVLVLFHDRTLDRVTDHEGQIQDYSWRELEEVRVMGEGGIYAHRSEPLVRLDTFLKHFAAHETMHFAIEVKQPGIEEQLLDLVNAYALGDRVIMTSFNYNSLSELRRLDASVQLGYLTRDLGETALQQLLAIDGQQICPVAEGLTAERVRQYHEAGVSVRAWGVRDPESVRGLVELGIDGFTLNFPDVYVRLMEQEKGRTPGVD